MVVSAEVGIEEAESRRDQLLRIAAECFLRRGFVATGVDEIGAAAGVTGPAIYRHFPNKQAILDALVLETGQRLLAMIREVLRRRGSPEQKLRALITVRIEYQFTRDRNAFAIRRSEGPHLSEEAQNRLKTFEDIYYSEWLRVLAPLRSDASTVELRTAIFGAHLLIGYSAIHEHAQDTESLKAQLERMTWAAIMA